MDIGGTGTDEDLARRLQQEEEVFAKIAPVPADPPNLLEAARKLYRDSAARLHGPTPAESEQDLKRKREEDDMKMARAIQEQMDLQTARSLARESETVGGPLSPRLLPAALARRLGCSSLHLSFISRVSSRHGPGRRAQHGLGGGLDPPACWGASSSGPKRQLLLLGRALF